MNIVDLIDRLAEIPESIILVLVALGSCIEYIFPPAPADSATLAASVLASRSGASWGLIALCGTLGSIAGSIIAWYIGRWIVRSGRVDKLKPSQREGIERVLRAFERHGPIWLCANRFLPGLRAFFFIAAAMAGIPLRVSTFWAAISAALWSILLVTLGVSLARNLETLAMWMQRIQVVGGVIVALIVIAAVRYFLRARKEAAKKLPPEEDVPRV